MKNRSSIAVLACVLIAAIAGTARAETPCESASTRLLDALDRGDYAGATSDFNDTMKSRLLPDTLAKAWQAIPVQFGERGAREPAQVSPTPDATVVVTTLHYGTSMIDAQVACNAEGKVSGFYIKPHH